MKRPLTLLPAATAALSLIAQPVITASENQPVIGDIITVHTAAWTSPGGAGNNQTWDFSGLVSAGTRTWSYIDPSQYGGADTLFPTANIAMTDGSTDTTFFAMSGTALTVVGEDGTLFSFGYKAPIAQGPDIMRWPVTLNDSWSGPITATFDIDGVATFYRSGSYSAVVDGSGVLVLPGNVSMEAVRIKYTSNEGNMAGVVSVTRKKTIYSYHTRFKAHPVVRIITDSLSSTMGLSLNTLTTEWLDATELGVPEPGTMALGLAPNPAHDRVVIDAARPVVAVVLRDAVGREQPVGVTHIAGGRAELAIGGLPPGPYLVQVTAADGTRATAKLMVE